MIENNVINHSFYEGVYLGFCSSNNTFSINKVVDCSIVIYLKDHSDNNIFLENKLRGNGFGFCSDYDSCCNNLLINNTFDSNYYALRFIQSINNSVTGDILTRNYVAILFQNSSCLNVVFENMIKENKKGIFLTDSSNNDILRNDFLGNDQNSFFVNSHSNMWRNNYWDRARVMPKIISGRLKLGVVYVPWFNFDWHPADKPRSSLF